MTKAKRYWNELMRELRVERTTAQYHWLMLKQLYGSEGRHYHTLTHITHFLDALHKFGQVEPALVIAAFYHDAIYDSQSKENERRSAELAMQFLTVIGAPSELAQTVNALILATEKHTVVDGAEHGLQELFLDCDLLILGETAKRYDTYARNIRQEYIHFNDQDYRSGRTLVMEKFLKRERIYFSFAVQEKHEKRARANIQRELKQLKSAQ